MWLDYHYLSNCSSKNVTEEEICFQTDDKYWVKCGGQLFSLMVSQWSYIQISFIVFYRLGIRIRMVSGRKEDDKHLAKISHPTREVEQSLNTKRQIETAKLVPKKSFLTMIDGKV